MDVLLFRPEDMRRLYNCSTYDVNDIPLEKRIHPLIGLSFIGLALFYETLYIPCLFAIRRHLKNSAYKIMFYIGLTDVVCITISGFITGYFAMSGVVFCSFPGFIYVAGLCALTLWSMESSSAIVLAFNRCVEMGSPRLSYVLFHGSRTWYWMMLPTLYSSCFLLFTKPVCFSGLYVSWFFNPHLGYIDDDEPIYENLMHSIHNCVVLIGLSGVYLLFVLIVITRSKTVAKQNRHGGSRKRTFVQVVMISIVNAAASALYVYMQFVQSNEVLILLASYTWLSAHGMPPIIYLTMNRTIRKDCRKWVVGFPNGELKTPTGLTFTDSSQTARGDEHSRRVSENARSGKIAADD